MFSERKAYLFPALNFKIGRLYLNEFSLFLRRQGIIFRAVISNIN